ncbi:UNVERIFIED_CONTAM: hypothetical protein HDU68_001688, partial [Siphonaria sp. JEL0065]
DVYTSDRDFRVTADAPTIAAFRSGLQKLDAAGTMIWANPIKPAVSNVTTAKTSSTTETSSTTKTSAISPTDSSSGGSSVVPIQQPAKDAEKTSASISVNPSSPALMISVIITVMFFF